MTKYIALVAALALCLAAALGVYGNKQAKKIKLYEAEITALHDDIGILQANLRRVEKVSAKRATALSQARAEQATAKEKLTNALKANPDWAAAELPDSVYDSLSGPRTGP